MTPTLQLDARGFAQALEEMAKATQAPLARVIRAEAASILKTWAGRTKVATVAAADRRATARGLRSLDLTDARLPGDISVNSGVRGPFGRIWVRSSDTRRGAGRPFRLAGTLSRSSYALSAERYRWSRGTWVDIQEAAADVSFALRKAVPAARRAIGLARQSVVQIADHLGIRLEAVPGGGISAAGIAKARAAMASDGRSYVNGTGKEVQRATEFFITLVNRLPHGVQLGMDRTLAGVINGRVRYFEQNLRRGVFNSLAEVAKKYPGLSVR
jgi:hypothetical protein